MIYVTPDVMPASVPAKEKKIMPLTMRNGVCLISYVHSIAVDIPVCDDNSAIMLQLKCLLYVTSHCVYQYLTVYFVFNFSDKFWFY